MPVFYFSQLMGLALGLNIEEYGWERHYISPQPIVERYAGAADE
jgi:heterodisulfide reductase subunit B